MTARAGMTDLIADLRAMTNAGTADYTINGGAYWTDDQLQQVLDRNRAELYAEPLHKIQQLAAGGSVVYKEYYTNAKNLESGTAVFYVQDGTWATVGTANYTPDYRTGRLSFAADTGGSTLYLTARSYNLNRAAAQVWRQKAAHLAESAFDWSTDNHRVNKSQAITNCLNMARQYEAAAGPSWMTAFRSDTDAE